MRALSFEKGKYKCKFMSSVLRGMFFTKVKDITRAKNTTQHREHEKKTLSTKLFNFKIIKKHQP